jgi:hypothetical protein
VVVAVGLTLVEPLADVDVNVPGRDGDARRSGRRPTQRAAGPEVMLAGLAVKELMVGLLAVVT